MTFGAQLNEFLSLLTLTAERCSFCLLSSWLFTLQILGQGTSLYFVKHLLLGSTAPHCSSTKNNTTWVTISLSLNVTSAWKSYFQHGRRSQLWLRYQILSVIRESDLAVLFYFWLHDSGAAHCSDDTVSHNWELWWGGRVKALIFRGHFIIIFLPKQISPNIFLYNKPMPPKVILGWKTWTYSFW